MHLIIITSSISVADESFTHHLTRFPLTIDIGEHMRARNHQNIVPINDKSYVKLFKQESGIRNNPNIPSTQEEDIKFNCYKWDKNFTTKWSLKLHVQSVHEDTKFTCAQCDKQFTSKGYLKQHVQSAHEGVNFPCTQCDK